MQNVFAWFFKWKNGDPRIEIGTVMSSGIKIQTKQSFSAAKHFNSSQPVRRVCTPSHKNAPTRRTNLSRYKLKHETGVAATNTAVFIM